jgi:hypothetical protein
MVPAAIRKRANAIVDLDSTAIMFVCPLFLLLNPFFLKSFVFFSVNNDALWAGLAPIARWVVNAPAMDAIRSVGNASAQLAKRAGNVPKARPRI